MSTEAETLTVRYLSGRRWSGSEHRREGQRSSGGQRRGRRAHRQGRLGPVRRLQRHGDGLMLWQAYVSPVSSKPPQPVPHLLESEQSSSPHAPSRAVALFPALQGFRGARSLRRCDYACLEPISARTSRPNPR